MALAMVHLLSAYAWAEDKEELANDPLFYLGAISPDAMHVRDGSDKSRKNYFHLNNWRTVDETAVLEYWKEHHSPFDLGYGHHVLLDGQWATLFRHDFPEILLPSGKPDPEIYYNDTIRTDMDLYRTSPETPFLFEMLKNAGGPEDHPYLTKEEFEIWRDSTVGMYVHPSRETQPARFLTVRYASDFISRVNNLITRVFEKAKESWN